MTIVELTQKVTDLETQLSTANTKVTTLEGQLTAESEKVTKVEGEKLAIEGQLTAETAKVTKLEGEKATLNTQLTDANAAKVKAEGDLKTTDERTGARLREISARNGGTLPPKDHNAGNFTGNNSAAKTHTRAEFDALSPSAKSAFCKAGGKITD